jgi:dipeptidyl aminopeptidase/acylaminoacyl peptidase
VFVSAGEVPWGIWVPKSTDVPWDSVRIKGRDGVPVFLVESRVDDSPQRRWVIYFHGNAGTVGSRSNVGRYRLLRQAGFNVLAVEYRGYGAALASGSPSEAGIYADALTAWDYLATRGVTRDRIIVYGWSLGSGPATYLAAEKSPAAVVTEGAFTSLAEIGAARYPWAPASLLLRNRFDNLGRAQRIAVPWVIFHATADAKVPFSHAERLRASAQHGSLVVLTSGHGDGVVSDSAAALSTLRQWAQR